ncbi:MocR-like pyridoxine biosynthesis transcription factor PdxR [Kordiimonas aestuarii]|uniref:MocR-like pyridoxine biosynthesis transcription factor PdxR n=1 Tax=Kordiimonas aestuarii TaxID=1005925 RepID=UPI0021D2603C|nr:PLP-dependent aminotransferase family protein [Kordiimonas aestuarii]
MFETLFSPGLDTGAAQPLNEQLQAMLRQAILERRLPAGKRLPATRALAGRLDISRNTVLAAYEHLIAEGYLETRQGAGTFVSADLPDAALQIRAGPDAIRREALPPRAAKRPLSGMPALDQFPVDIWARLSGRVWRGARESQLLYNDPAGYLPLRQAIATYLEAARGVVADADQIIITSGIQQSFHLLAESVIPKDRTIILEDPGYPGMASAVRNLPHPVRFTPIDEDGVLPPTPGGKAGLLVVCPSRQYPLGHTMPLKRRLELLEWAKKEGSFLLEDDYDSEFRYAGRPINSLQGIDGGKCVIYSGSFSKSLFLALRLGYLIVPPEMTERLVRHRAAVDSFPSISNQILLTQFIEEGHFSRHIRRLRAVHKKRLSIFMTSAQKWLGQHFDFQKADTGLHVVAFCRAGRKLPPDTALSLIAGKAQLGASPLSESYHEAEARQGLLFGFANIAEREIDNRLKELAALLSQETGF